MNKFREKLDDILTRICLLIGVDATPQLKALVLIGIVILFIVVLPSPLKEMLLILACILFVFYLISL